MGERTFWQIVDRTARHREDQVRQEQALAGELSKLEPDEIVAFHAELERALNRAYAWRLWGAVYVVNGGASDDGFDYFRLWLIAQGERTYRRVLADPDALGAFVPADAAEALEFERFAYIPVAVWAARTGKSDDAFPRAAEAEGGGEPSGEPFEEDQLPALYPKLWARFGDEPLM